MQFKTFTRYLCLTAALVHVSACDAGEARMVSLQDKAAQSEAQNRAPERDQIIVSHQIQRILDHHYRSQKLNDQVSAKILSDYLEYLDPNHSIFTQADLSEFVQYQDKIDDALQDGKLEIGFVVYQRYENRLREALNYGIELLKTKDSFDFTVDESLVIDRTEINHPDDENALRDLWRKKTKDEMISNMLADKTEEKARELLIKRYQNRVNMLDKINSNDVFEMFINTYTGTLDPHTRYFSPHESENFNINMSLQLQGIGARLSAEDEYTKIIELIAGGPAEKSGLLHASDRIIGIAQGDDGEMVDVVGWRIDEVVTLIRGEKGTVVRLLIIPHNAIDDSATKVVRLVRDTIKLEDSAAKKSVMELQQGDKTRRIGVITLPSFYHSFNGQSTRSSSDDVAKLIQELKQESVEGLIIDLRNNGGGSLEEVRRMVGFFIEKGPVVQTKQSNGDVAVLEDTDPSMLYDGPMAVIINRLSASASEIFAGAIKDYDRGVIIGNGSYGKGTVQNVSDVLFKGQIKLTTAMFYRISGASTQHKGVLPQITYPTLIDETLIGESALTNSMPWEQIERAKYAVQNRIAPYVSTLQTKHQARVANNPEFSYVIAKSQLLAQTREQSALSLNLAKRKNKQDEIIAKQLEIENRLRKAQGEKPLKSLDELEEESENTQSDSSETDAFAEEAGYILLDLIQLSQNTGLQQSA
ncbi:MAG: carboxy terminal-processing peptidase [Pseudomonadota bacterium]|nr:carboxy terminal-processing peptidase [Pseudomonadota bacterium]